MRNADITKKIVTILFAVYAFLGNKPYFTWDTFEHGKFANIVGVPIATLVGVLSIGFALLFILWRGAKIERRKFTLAAFVIILSFFTVLISGGSSHALSMEWVFYIVVALFVLLPDEYQKAAYNIYKSLFVLTLILPIIYYVLVHIGVQIPYDRLESYEPIKVSTLMYYKHYPLASQLTSQYVSELTEFRLSGIYDEAGRLGTLAGLFLVSERFELKGNWKNIIIFVAGVLSFSLAFWIFVVLFLVCWCFERGMLRRMWVLVGGLVCYFLFIQLDFSSIPGLARLQSRMLFVDGGLTGDNRASDAYNQLFSSLFTMGLKPILFGNGFGSLGELQGDMIDGSSYKSLIFDYGFVGFAGQIIWLAKAAFGQLKNRAINNITQYILLFIAYLSNIYQRPTMMNFPFILIFIGGLVLQKERETYAKKNRKKRNE